MQQQQPFVLVVSAANTGRGPMAVALLQRLLEQARLNWRVETAGVTGHEDDPAEPEARGAMLHLGLDVSEHRARAVDTELVAAADVLLAVDSGIARVLKVTYPDAAARITSLGDIAGRQRDIPELFRMQLGAWLSYAIEMETLLKQGFDRLMGMAQAKSLPPADDDTTASMATSPTSAPAVPAAPTAAHLGSAQAHQSVYPSQDEPDQRAKHIQRCLHLIAVLKDMPEVIAWEQARRQFKDELDGVVATPAQPDDLVQAYTTLLHTMLDLRTHRPDRPQCDMLERAVQRMYEPIDSQALAELSRLMVTWTSPPPPSAA